MSEFNDEMKEFYKLADNKTEVLAKKTKRFTATTAETLKRTSFGIVGVVLIIAIVLLNFVTIDFGISARWREFTTNSVLLIVCTYWFSINFGEYGTQTGYDSDKYKVNLANYNALKTTIQSTKNILILPKFCQEWTENKLVRDRQNALYEVGIEYEDYIAKGYNKLSQQEIKNSDLTDLEKIAIENANNIKPTVLDPAKLINIRRQKTKQSTSATGRVPTDKIPLIRGKMLLNTVLNSILACGIIISTAAQGTFLAIAICVFKIAIMVVFAFRAYLKHYSIIAEEMSEYIDSLSEYLKEFIKWCEKA